ncbi:MAG: hypothetical protein ABI444_13700 [Candidatus Kapaibacterium sp.]|jgi:hypothetical protein
MPRKSFVPMRRDELILLAAEARKKYAGMSIDEVADREHVFLHRERGPAAASGGYAFAQIEMGWDGQPYVFEAIVLNPEFQNPHGERISEREIFWHEYFHLWYSPSMIDSPDRFLHHYSTVGVLHAQEERRANEFTAAVLVGKLELGETAETLSERCGISSSLASIAFDLLRNR